MRIILFNLEAWWAKKDNGEVDDYIMYRSKNL